jgi:hypothetical protein
MKMICMIAVLSCLAMSSLCAQDGGGSRSIPLTVSVFSESVSLPDFRGFFKNPNWGVRIGTEFYYRRNDSKNVFQTVNLGYYRHSGLQQGIFVSSEFGYRRFIGNFFADATVGAGYLHLISELKRYEPDGGGFKNASQRMHKVMPTVGLGMGYRFGDVTFFSRYEVFGEMPFSYGGTPVLPHKALHLGTRFQPFK